MGAPALGIRAARTRVTRIVLLPFFAAGLLLSPPADTASGADVLVAGGYIETPALMRFAKSFQTPNVLAICRDALVAQFPRVKVTGCEAESCGPGGCAPGQCQPPKSGWREVAVYSDCDASAFVVGIEGLRPGPIPAATADRERNRVVGHMEGEGYRFRLAERDYLVRTVMTNKGSHESRARLEILRDEKPYVELLEIDALKMNCAVTWMGDLNGDGVPDVVAECWRNIYERIYGVFLSRNGKAGSYEFIKQREVGGAI